MWPGWAEWKVRSAFPLTLPPPLGKCYKAVPAVWFGLYLLSCHVRKKLWAFTKFSGVFSGFCESLVCTTNATFVLFLTSGKFSMKMGPRPGGSGWTPPPGSWGAPHPPHSRAKKNTFGMPKAPKESFDQKLPPPETTGQKHGKACFGGGVGPCPPQSCHPCAPCEVFVGSGEVVMCAADLSHWAGAPGFVVHTLTRENFSVGSRSANLSLAAPQRIAVSVMQQSDAAAALLGLGLISSHTHPRKRMCC